MAPTREQLIANIGAMEKQGAPQGDIQAYLDTFKGQQPTTPVPQPAKKKGFIRNVAEDIVRPFAKTGLSGVRAAQGTASLFRGEGVEASNRIYDRSANLPFLEETKPLRRATDVKALAEAAGTGIEAGSIFMGGGGTASVAKSGLVGAIKAGAKTGAKAGLASGVLHGLGTGLQDEKATVGTVLGKTAAEGIVGGAVGGIAGGVLAAPVRAATAVERAAEITPGSRMKEMTGTLQGLKNVYDDGVKYAYEGGKKVEKSNPITTLQGLKSAKALKVVNNRADVEPILAEIDNEITALAQPRALRVSASRKTVSYDNFKTAVMRKIENSKTLRSQLKVGTVKTRAASMLQDARTSYGGRFTLQNMDEIRMGMNKTYDPELRDAARMIGDTMRDFVYDLDEGSREILAREGELIVARDFAEKLGQHVVKGGRLGGYVNQIIGTVVGAASGLPWGTGAVLGGAVGRVADRVIRESYFNPIQARASRTAVKAAKTVFGRVR